MTWREMWDMTVLFTQVTLLTFLWALVLLPTVYAAVWLWDTFLEER